jgi:hypothetical protein
MSFWGWPYAAGAGLQGRPHIKNLIGARVKEVADRRDIAGKLVEKHQRGHAEDMREAIIFIQKAIEAIDRAIADERRIANEERC